MKHGPRLFGFEIKASDEGSRTFEGALASSHLDLGNWFYKDIVRPGAFKRTLDHFKKSKDGYIPLLDSHDRFSVFSVVGKMTDGEERLTGKMMTYAKEDGTILEVPEMFLDTQWKIDDGMDGDRVLDRLRSGSVRKMSMGYESVREDFVQLKAGRTRQLHEVKLGEGSLVVFPMNPNANINTESVKSALSLALSGLNITTLAKKEREDIVEEIRALLLGTPADEEAPKSAPSAATLAPDDPKRLAAEATLRNIRLRAFA